MASEEEQIMTVGLKSISQREDGKYEVCIVVNDVSVALSLLNKIGFRAIHERVEADRQVEMSYVPASDDLADGGKLAQEAQKEAPKKTASKPAPRRKQAPLQKEVEQEIVDHRLEDEPGPAIPTGPPSDLASANSFRKVMEWMITNNYKDVQTVLGMCEGWREEIPALKRLGGDLAERIERALEVLLPAS